MALDLGTLQLQISANTGDAINRLDTVKSSAEDLEKHENITLNVKANTEDAAQQISALQTNLGSIGTGTGSVDVDTSSAMNNITELASTVSSLFSEKGTAALNIPSLLKSLGTFCSTNLGSTFATISSSLLSVLGPAGAVVAALSIAYNTASKWVENIEAKAEEYRETAKTVSITADDIITESTVTGIETRMTAVYMALEGITDVDFSTIESSIKYLANTTLKEAEDSSSDAGKAFATLGVSLTNPDGSSKTAAQIFEETTTAMQNFQGTEAELESLGYDLFGKNYGSLKPLMAMDSDAMASNISYLAELHATLSETETNLLGVLNDLLEWEKLSEEGLDNTKALLVAEDTAKVTQANTEKNKFKTQALSGESISSQQWDEAVQLYVSGMVGSAATSYEANNKEKYIDALWDSQTKGLMAEAYFERFESGEGNFYDLVAGAVYWIQDWGADIKLAFMNLLDFLGLEEYNVNFVDATAEEEHKTTATTSSTGEDVGNTVLDNGQTLDEALASNTIDSYEAVEDQSNAIIDAALKLFGIDYSSLTESQKKQLEGADRTFDEQLADGDTTEAATEALYAALYKIITGKSGNAVDWTNLDDTGNEDVLHYDETSYEDFTEAMEGAWDTTYIDNLNETIASQATSTDDNTTSNDNNTTSTDENTRALDDNTAQLEKGITVSGTLTVQGDGWAGTVDASGY